MYLTKKKDLFFGAGWGSCPRAFRHVSAALPRRSNRPPPGPKACRPNSSPTDLPMDQKETRREWATSSSIPFESPAAVAIAFKVGRNGGRDAIWATAVVRCCQYPNSIDDHNFRLPKWRMASKLGNSNSVPMVCKTTATESGAAQFIRN